MINIRNAGLDDVSTISCVLAASWKSAYRGIVHDEYLDAFDNNHWVDFLNMGLKNKMIFAMVLEEEQNIIGAAILSGDKKDAHLMSFYLLPEKMGQGLGHILYNGIETALRNRGFAKCVLYVLGRNNRAIHFYKTHGFIDINRKVHTKLGKQEYICNTYEKCLLI